MRKFMQNFRVSDQLNSRFKHFEKNDIIWQCQKKKLYLFLYSFKQD